MVITMMATLYMGCKKVDNNKKTEEEIQLNKLNGVWKLESANDGMDRTADFPNLALTLAGSFVPNGIYDYSLTGKRPNPSPWPVNGKWSFGTNKLTELIRDPNTTSETPMTYQVTDTKLTLSFTVPDGSPGWTGGTSRTNSVSGNWTFTFNK